MALCTFGYEGLGLPQFIARLHAAHIREVVDVRELPLSRKAGFSKTALAEALELEGIAYRHVRALGCPKQIRQRYRKDGDWSRYVKDFSVYLEKQKAEISELARAARKSAICLVCFEANFSECHRSIVAKAAADRGAPPVMHLTATGAIPGARLRAAA